MLCAHETCQTGLYLQVAQDSLVLVDLCRLCVTVGEVGMEVEVEV